MAASLSATAASDKLAIESIMHSAISRASTPHAKKALTGMLTGMLTDSAKPSSIPSDFDAVAATPQSALELCGQADSSALEKIKAIVAHHGIKWLNAAPAMSGWQSVHFAATQSTPAMLEWLVDADATWNSMTMEFHRGVPAGSTILHVAVVFRQLETFNYILSFSDMLFVQWQTYTGKTAMDLVELIPGTEREPFKAAFAEWKKCLEDEEADGQLRDSHCRVTRRLLFLTRLQLAWQRQQRQVHPLQHHPRLTMSMSNMAMSNLRKTWLLQAPVTLCSRSLLHYRFQPTRFKSNRLLSVSYLIDAN